MEEIIRSTLKRIESDYNVITDKDKEYLSVIETTIQTLQEEQKRALETIKNSKITLSGVSESAKISRQTLHNRPILAEYIKQRQKDLNPSDKDYEQIIKDLKFEIEQLHKRDAEFIELKRTNEQLIKNYEALRKSITLN